MLQWIDNLNERLGRITSWLVLLVVLLGAWNAVARYLTRFTDHQLSSNAYLEAQWYLFSAIFLLGAAYTLQRDEHVRVDVLHGALPVRARAAIDLAGTLLFLIPFCVFMIWASWFPVKNSWAILENSPDPGGLPRYPVKTLIPLAFVLLLLQGVAILKKKAALLRKKQQATSNVQHRTFNLHRSTVNHERSV
jgi:TRAP-type mannitol/chloroaromatic compound transport system permease small subunit